jgi:hypothetical protein
MGVGMTVIWDGYPENRERSGWHWLQYNEDDPEPREWSPLFGEWWLGGDEDYGGGWQSANYVGRNYTYLGPCLLPAEVAERVKDAEAERDRLREALRDLLDLCSHADFKNGVTDATGTMDEGEHWASVFIDRARTALGKDRA